jgi:hypothetical protein
MGLLTKIFGGENAVAGVTAVGNIVDNLFTSKDEKLTHEEIRMRIAMEPHLVQTEINKIEATSKHWFAATWRPAIGWVCALGCLNFFLVNPWIQWFTGKPGPDLPFDILMQLTLGMLGLLGTMRTVEKVKGRAK